MEVSKRAAAKFPSMKSEYQNLKRILSSANVTYAIDKRKFYEAVLSLADKISSNDRVKRLRVSPRLVYPSVANTYTFRVSLKKKSWEDAAYILDSFFALKWAVLRLKRFRYDNRGASLEVVISRGKGK